MGLLAHFMQGPPVTPVGHSESLLPQANPANIGREQPAQALIDQAHAIAAPVAGQIRDGVGVIRGTHIETLPEMILEQSEHVTAYIDRFVHIPWLHGEQPVVK